MRVSGFKRFFAFVSLVTVLVACQTLMNPTQAESATLQGYVKHVNAPLESSCVVLYRAGNTSSRGSGALVLGIGCSDSSGIFTIDYKAPSDSRAVLYLIATGPADSIRMASVLGTTPFPSQVTVNERTTVATAFAMAQFIKGDQIGGTYPGLQNAAGTLQNLVDITNGNIGQVLDGIPNGDSTPTRAKLNTLANMLEVYIRYPDQRDTFLALCPSASGGVPLNSLDAMANIAKTTWRESTIGSLYNYARMDASDSSIDREKYYTPDLSSAPDHWALVLRYQGNGRELDGPGNMVFDADGNVYVGNNYTFSLDPADPSVCGGTQLIKLTPTGQDAPGAPYEGGGIYGAGFGITLDKKGFIWVGNFSFQGSKCTKNQADYWDTVSRFNSKGEAVPSDAVFSDSDAQPQGMISAKNGDVWVANCRGASVTRYKNGDPNNRNVVKGSGENVFDRPFDVALDTRGRVWVTNNNSHKVFVIDDPEASDPVPRLAADPKYFQRPMGIASDSLGNVWVSNSGALPAPCGGSDTPETIIDFLNALSHDAQVDGASVTMISPNGEVAAGSPFRAGGLYMPWGIAVDGADNVLVANFTGRRLGFLCGANPANCPPGVGTGDPISPAAGYTFEGLARTTAVQVDPSGNVWAVNNWEVTPFPTNPGGHYMTVFIGLAAPVKTPMLGPPQQP
jgi:hypothetical protein